MRLLADILYKDTKMTKDQLIRHLFSKNTHWESDGANFTANGIRKLIGVCFDAGHKEGFEKSEKKKKAVDDLLKKSRPVNNPLDDLFGGFSR
jgi:hypothetical protein